MLIQGQGCETNAQEGLHWLKQSAQGGCVYGEGLLARRYLAMKLYSKAAQTAFRYTDWLSKSNRIPLCDTAEHVKLSTQNPLQLMTMLQLPLPPPPSPSGTAWVWLWPALCLDDAYSWEMLSTKVRQRQRYTTTR